MTWNKEAQLKLAGSQLLGADVEEVEARLKLVECAVQPLNSLRNRSKFVERGARRNLVSSISVISVVRGSSCSETTRTRPAGGWPNILWSSGR
jgi:hypothetical protein